MGKVQAVKELLLLIERSSSWKRMEYISSLQNLVWDGMDLAGDDIEQVFSDLAYDLNFYEDDPRDRDEERGYYGDDKLIGIINTAIKKIEAYEANE